MKTILVAAALAALPTELALRAALQQAQEQVIEAQVKAAQCQAYVSRMRVEGDLRKALGASETDEIDWTTTPPSIKSKSPR